MKPLVSYSCQVATNNTIIDIAFMYAKHLLSMSKISLLKRDHNSDILIYRILNTAIAVSNWLE